MSTVVDPLDTQAFDAHASLLELREVDAFYGPIQALRQVSFSVAAGERVALVGANGAGKTTTLRVISGLIAPGRGDVMFDGDQIRVTRLRTMTASRRKLEAFCHL